ncbi:MAG: DUF882 domain-containing protein [Deltaproteobacteria bacterium]|nr:DUF882 domain-containing protein [Deltaproteobacteria bacterium]MBW2071781.1 DUF882 domain-containing protein [Deltaproteobacteria bacterium]
MMPEHKLTRRAFLGAGLAAAGSLCLPTSVCAAIRRQLVPARSLSFYNLHTEEHLEVVYWQGGKYLAEGLAEINYILRDYRTGELHRIETRLLDLLYALREKICCRQPFQVISGYRSPATNAYLRKKSRAVAKHSLHIEGKAIDIRLAGYPLSRLRDTAASLRGGGVGYYPRSNFVHLDVGKIRYW